MASKVQVLLVDDVDGGAATETVTFGLDGTTYEIDLSGKHAKQLRYGLTSWVEHSRKIGRAGGKARSGLTTTARAAHLTDRPDLTEVRSWARQNGFEVSDRGRVSGKVLQAYQDAQ